MKLDMFYQEMKDAMQYLGVSWGDMHLIQVSIRDDRIRFTYDGRAVSFCLPKEVV